MNVAMLLSGGVDSAVALHQLIEQGHDTTLFYIRIGPEGTVDPADPSAVLRAGDCSAEEDIEMCRLIARRYGRPLEVVSLQEEYWQSVMEYALARVRAGLTPNPDVMCNRMIKFGYFEQRWGRDFDMTATGHYATTEWRDGVKYLATSPDAVKDQTDFLAQITYPQLLHASFPIGEMPKSRVREIASLLRLPNATRRDSQGICFLGKIDYNDFLRRHLGERPGPVVEIETGRKIGEHRGYWFHTIGQRKGLGLSGGPWFVVRKNTRENVIYVSRGYDTDKQYGRQLRLAEMHFISGDPWGDDCRERPVMFKNRHTPLMLPATISRVEGGPAGEGGDYVVRSSERVQGIAPGQFCVVYSPDGRLCYGSGTITL